MQALKKIGIVVAGYVAAGLLAALAVAAHMALTAAERGSSDGMSAFGDAILFLGVFGLAALVHTIAVYRLLRSRKSEGASP